MRSVATERQAHARSRVLRGEVPIRDYAYTPRLQTLTNGNSRRATWFLSIWSPRHLMTTCPSGTAAAPPCLTFKMSAWLMKKTCSHLSTTPDGEARTRLPTISRRTVAFSRRALACLMH